MSAVEVLTLTLTQLQPAHEPVGRQRRPLRTEQRGGVAAHLGRQSDPTIGIGQQQLERAEPRLRILRFVDHQGVRMSDEAGDRIRRSHQRGDPGKAGVEERPQRTGELRGAPVDRPYLGEPLARRLTTARARS
jgi:hypothetical protein